MGFFKDLADDAVEVGNDAEEKSSVLDEIFDMSGIDNKVTLIVGSVLVTLSWALLIYSLFRTFSKRTQARAAENYRYFVCKNKVLGWFRRGKARWQDRKTHRYFRCPQCRATVRVPKGKGKIRITCPKCRHQFVKKS